MPVTSVAKDPTALTMTVVAEFPVSLQRLWDAYADPRQLERFWGPVDYPATFTRHDMYPGGRAEYVMTGPDGDQHAGYWEFLSVDEPNSFEALDGFANPDGTPNTDLPTARFVFAFEATATGSRMTTTTHFASAEQLTQLLEMGMEEGMASAMSQIDAVLADLASFAAELPTHTQILSPTRVRISRVIAGPVETVWRAHHEAALLQRWLLGPDGWTMPVCELATGVGGSYRYEWARTDGSERFGFTGQLLESVPPHRAVTTESMIGMAGDPSVNELTLTAVQGGTLLSLVITYPSEQVRDIVLGTGMTDGMETSYARLEQEVLATA